MRMVTDDLRQVIVVIIVLRRGRVAEPRLELADDESREVRPERGRLRLGADVVAQRVVSLQSAGGIEIAGVEVVEGGDVGRTLDGGVAAQGEDTAAGPAD